MKISAPLVSVFDSFIRQPLRWLLLILLCALVTTASYTWHIYELERHANTMATLRGRLVFEMIETTRLWAARHGGVYAPVTEATAPNAWLDIPEKNITTPSGRPLTKINPAYMTRQLGELIAQERDMRIHLTSLKPINPGNEPDPWERKMLEGFELKRSEQVSIVGSGDTASFRYMAPLEVKAPCMACHKKQGYQLGDVRGGISVTFPASYIYNIIDEQKRGFAIIHLAVFGLFSALIWGSLMIIRRNLLMLEATRSELLENEKMASLGRLVAGFAHEVNTPVGVAVGAASQSRQLVSEISQLIDQEEVSEEDLRQRLTLLDETSSLTLANLRRAAAMVQSFKRTAVDQASEAERTFMLAEVIEDVRKTLNNTFKNTSIRIEVDCPADLSMYGPVGMLEQLLTNLLQNSRLHAFADGTHAGSISIRAGLQRETDKVCIDFSDDGAGMEASTLAHAFEPFYTTRRGSGGSGLGLYLVYNLVTQGLGGSIACTSQRGAGTRFTIEFPHRMSPLKPSDHENSS
jgi:signal transduction histidine kinase